MSHPEKYLLLRTTHHEGVLWSAYKLRLERDERTGQGMVGGLVAGGQGSPGVGRVVGAGAEHVQGGPEGEEGGGEGRVGQGGGAEILDCRHALQHYHGSTHTLQQICEQKNKPDT